MIEAINFPAGTSLMRNENGSFSPVADNDPRGKFVTAYDIWMIEDPVTKKLTLIETETVASEIGL